MQRNRDCKHTEVLVCDSYSFGCQSRKIKNVNFQQQSVKLNEHNVTQLSRTRLSTNLFAFDTLSCVKCSLAAASKQWTSARLVRWEHRGWRQVAEATDRLCTLILTRLFLMGDNAIFFLTCCSPHYGRCKSKWHVRLLHRKWWICIYLNNK